MDVICPGCGTCYHLARGPVSRRMRCPNKVCREMFTIEAAGSSEPESAVASVQESEDVPEAEVAEAETVDVSAPIQADIVDAEPVSPPVEAVETAGAEIVDDGSNIETSTVGASGEDSLADEQVTFAVAERVEDADSQSDVETLPAEAIVAAPQRVPGAVPTSAPLGPQPPSAGLPGAAAGEAFPRAKTSGRRGRRRKLPRPSASKTQKTRKQKRVLRFQVLAVMLVGLLLVGSGVIYWKYGENLGPPSADERWAELTQQYDEHKWDRFQRRLDDFAEGFPDDPRVAQIPFFRDMAEAGDEVYSLTGDAEQGLARIQQIFRDHRDNPAYKDYSIDIYQGLTKLIDRLLASAVATSDREKLKAVRDAFDLLETVGQSRDEPFVKEKISELRSKIARSEYAVEGALAREELISMLNPEHIVDPNVIPDEVYGRVERTLASRPELRDDTELLRLLSETYRAEPQRVVFEPERTDTGQMLPVVDRCDQTRQGCTLVVAWGKSSPVSDELVDNPLLRDSDRIVLALARESSTPWTSSPGSFAGLGVWVSIHTAFPHRSSRPRHPPLRSLPSIPRTTVCWPWSEVAAAYCGVIGWARTLLPR